VRCCAQCGASRPGTPYRPRDRTGVDGSSVLLPPTFTCAYGVSVRDAPAACLNSARAPPSSDSAFVGAQRGAACCAMVGVRPLIARLLCVGFAWLCRIFACHVCVFAASLHGAAVAWVRCGIVCCGARQHRWAFCSDRACVCAITVIDTRRFAVCCGVLCCGVLMLPDAVQRALHLLCVGRRRHSTPLPPLLHPHPCVCSMSIPFHPRVLLPLLSFLC